MLARLGHKVMMLKRIAIGPVKLSRLKRGKARRVSLGEMKALRAAAHAGPRRDRATDDRSAAGARPLRSQETRR